MGRVAWVWWLLAGAGLAILVTAAACDGGDGRLSTEEYFQRVAAIARDAREQESAAQPSEEQVANSTPEEQKQTGIELLRSFADINEDAVGEIEDLDPPDNIQDAHDTLVAAGKDLAQTFRDLADDAEDVPPEGIEDFFNTKVFVESTFAAFDEACFAVQKIADDSNIDVDLICAPEE